MNGWEIRNERKSRERAPIEREEIEGREKVRETVLQQRLFQFRSENKNWSY